MSHFGTAGEHELARGGRRRTLKPPDLPVLVHIDPCTYTCGSGSDRAPARRLGPGIATFATRTTTARRAATATVSRSALAASPRSGRRRVAAQQAAGGITGGAIVFDRHLAVHQDVTIADGALYPAPLAGGKIVRLLDRRHLQVFEVIDDDVGGFAFLERAAVGEPSAVRRQSRELPMHVLEGKDVVVARRADDRFGRVAARGEKARVCSS